MLFVWPVQVDYLKIRRNQHGCGQANERGQVLLIGQSNVHRMSNVDLALYLVSTPMSVDGIDRDLFLVGRAGR